MLTSILRVALPLRVRMWIVSRVAAHGAMGLRLPRELLRDLAERDPNRFHRLLWSNHLAYSESYDVSRFEDQKLEASRRLLLADLETHLRRRGLTPDRDVRSVFDLGSSLGYLLRHLEKHVFPSALHLMGMDIDARAIDEGQTFLRRVGSRVRLQWGSATELDRALDGQTYDVVLCCGVLLYFDQPTAARIVRSLLRHTRMVVGLIDLAHPTQDNATLVGSQIRPSDLGFIHNVDALLRDAGATPITRRWLPRPLSADTSPPYLTLAVP
jgi:SAM-dependent methyltransferase